MSRLHAMAMAIELALALALPAAAQKTPPDVDREFTAQEYAAYNAALKADKPGRTPARLVKGYVPLYPISRALSHKSGVCVLQFTVDTQGRPTEIARAQEDDRKMCDHAVIALRHWQFEPATQDGKPVVSRYRVPITYSFQ